MHTHAHSATPPTAKRCRTAALSSSVTHQPKAKRQRSDLYLRQHRQHASDKRAKETAEERACRLKKMRDYMRARRALEKMRAPTTKRNKRRRAARIVTTPEERERKCVQRSDDTGAAEQQRAEAARLVERSRSPLSRDEYEARLLLQQRDAHNSEAVKGAAGAMKYLILCAACGGRVHY